MFPACHGSVQLLMTSQVRVGFRWQGAGCDLTAAVQNQDQAPLLFSFCKPELVCNMEKLYMEAQDGLKTIAPPLFLNIFFYFLLV